MIDIPCPQCGTIYHADSSHLGKCIRCSRCGAVVFLIESAKAEVIKRPHQEVARRALSSKLNFSTDWPVSVLKVAISSAVVLAALCLMWYRGKNADTVGHPAPQSPSTDVQQHRDAVPGGAPTAGEADFADLDSFVLKEERPRVYHSLLTGAGFCDGTQPKGKGVLEIENGTSEDAALRLYDVSAKQVVRCLFVKARDSLRVTGISQGTYDLNYTTGLDWESGAEVFRWEPTYNQFGQPFVYSEQQTGDGVRYREIRVTLHPVIGGNVQAVPISREVFLRGTKNTSQQR
jgi:hypothetical protein